MPHIREPMEKITTPISKYRTFPYRSPNLPNTSKKAHMVSRYTDEIHWIWSSPAPNAFCMTGNATLTMLESSVAMNVMMRTVSRIAHLFEDPADAAPDRISPMHPPP